MAITIDQRINNQMQIHFMLLTFLNGTCCTIERIITKFGQMPNLGDMVLSVNHNRRGLNPVFLFKWVYYISKEIVDRDFVTVHRRLY